jgi:aromatic ring hydroxylase
MDGVCFLLFLATFLTAAFFLGEAFLVFDETFFVFDEVLFVFGEAFFAADRFVELLFFLFTAFAFVGPLFALFCFLAGFLFLLVAIAPSSSVTELAVTAATI